MNRIVKIIFIIVCLISILINSTVINATQINQNINKVKVTNCKNILIKETLHHYFLEKYLSISSLNKSDTISNYLSKESRAKNVLMSTLYKNKNVEYVHIYGCYY